MEDDKQNISPAGTLHNAEEAILCIQWTPTDWYTVFLKMDADVIARSPTFQVKGATWSLELLRRLPSKDGVFVSVNRHQSEVASHTMSCQILVKENQHIIGGYVAPKCVKKLIGIIAETQKFLSLATRGSNIQVLCTFYQEGKTFCQEGGTSEISPDVSEKQSENTEGIDALTSQMKNLFNSQENCDFVIRVKGKEFQVHKAILSARSSVLAAMMQHDMVNKKSSTIEIVDCEPDAFEQFLLYLYTGRIEELSWENAMSLYALGDKYDLQHLKKECIQFMGENMCIDAFYDAITLGVRHNLSTLIKSVEEFFLNNVMEILLTPKWQLLLKEHPVTCNELYIKHTNSTRLKK